ncbi:MAG TPA: response regulator [Patescibacteria group bacterium]|nr:response regulator [Patescibacteria group bacterium]
MKQRHIKVLIVEDDPMVADINRQFTEAVSGFVVVGIARNGRQALEMLNKLKPDLVILDISMPELDGLAVLGQLRSKGVPVDVILITASNDSETIGQVMRQGIIDYLIKPFKLERYRATLESYRDLYFRLQDKDSLSQQDLDGMFAAKMAKNGEELPKNFHPQTLNHIVSFLQEKSQAQSAEEVAAGTGISRVTARRYLEYLVTQGQLQMVLEYISVGRPVHRFIIKS